LQGSELSGYQVNSYKVIYKKLSIYPRFIEKFTAPQAEIIGLETKEIQH